MTSIFYSPSELLSDQEQWLDQKVVAVFQHIKIVLRKAKPAPSYVIDFMCNNMWDDGRLFLPNHSLDKVKKKIIDGFDASGWSSNLEIFKTQGGEIRVQATIRIKENSGQPYR